MDLTELLHRELSKSNPLVNISITDVEKIKEQFTCCAEDELAYEKTKNSCQTEMHTLPDGQVCSISSMIFYWYDFLFYFFGQHYCNYCS